MHVNDAGAAIEAGIEAGRPHRISVTHFGDQVRAAPDLDTQAVVACARGTGPGRRSCARRARQWWPADRHSGRRPGQLLDAVRASHAGTVILLPNDSDTDLAARAAARAAAEAGINGACRALPHRRPGPGRARRLRPAGRARGQRRGDEPGSGRAPATAAVTVARKAALTSAGPCQPGDVLGIVDGDFALIGSDLYAVAEQVVDRLLPAGGELLTVVTGDGRALTIWQGRRRRGAAAASGSGWRSSRSPGASRSTPCCSGSNDRHDHRGHPAAQGLPAQGGGGAGEEQGPAHGRRPARVRAEAATSCPTELTDLSALVDGQDAVRRRPGGRLHERGMKSASPAGCYTVVVTDGRNELDVTFFNRYAKRGLDPGRTGHLQWARCGATRTAGSSPTPTSRSSIQAPSKGTSPSG